MATIISTKTSGVGGLSVTGDASGILQLASADGTTALTIDSSQNVGIGTSSPSAPLDIKVGTGKFTVGLQGAANAQLTASGNLRFNTTAGTTVFSQNTIESVRIDSSGNVGIGTSSPAQKLHVVGAVNATTYFHLGGNTSAPASDAAIYRPADGTLAFVANTAERMRIDSSGNVGIGTTAPNNKLTVGAPNGIVGAGTVASFSGVNVIASNTSGMVVITSTDSIAANIGGSIGFAATGTVAGYPTGSISGRRENATAGDYSSYMQFTTSGSNGSVQEKMRIDSSGNLLVGTTSALSTGSISFVASGAGGAAMLAARNSATAGGKFWTFGPDNGNAFRVFNQTPNGVYVTDGATSWSAFSDERLKTDLIPIANGLEKVNSLRSVTGRFKTDEEGVSRSFLIAQDVQKVLPEAVSVQDDELGTLGVAYTEVIPLLVASIKELKAIIDTQNARIEALEAK
jgi:hypothetical protein